MLELRRRTPLGKPFRPVFTPRGPLQPQDPSTGVDLASPKAGMVTGGLKGHDPPGEVEGEGQDTLGSVGARRWASRFDSSSPELARNRAASCVGKFHTLLFK